MTDRTRSRAAGDPVASDERQRAMYGQTWSDRLSRLLQAYHLTQARLAGVLGLSAPMVSQLMSGQRVKISNPLVYARIVRLEEELPAVAGDPARIAAVLAEMAAVAPILTTMTTSSPVQHARPGAVNWLRTAGTSADLIALAVLARDRGAEVLAEALTEAGQPIL